MLWDYDSGKLLREFVGHTKSIHEVAFTPDGKRLLSSSIDGTIRIWNVASGKQERLFDKTNAVTNDNALAITPDGNYFVEAGNKKLNYRELESGKVLWSKTDVPGILLEECTFSSDGKRLATISKAPNCHLTIYDTSDGREIRKLSHQVTSPMPTWDLRFLANDRWLLSAHAEGSLPQTTLLWDISSGRVLQEIDGAQFADVSPDGLTVVTKGREYKVRVWRLEPGGGTVARGTITPADGWVDVLKSLDLDQDAKGKSQYWKRVGAELTFGKETLTPGGTKSWLIMPLTLDGDYEYEVAFTGSNHPLVEINMPVADRIMGWMLSSFEGRKSGPKWAPVGELVESPLKDGVEHVAVVRVRQVRDAYEIVGELDGRELLRWTGDPSAFGEQPTYSKVFTTPRHHIAFATKPEGDQGTLVVHAIRLRMLDGEAKLLRPEDASTAPTAPPLAVAPFDEAAAKKHQQAWADHLGVPVEKEVDLPGGEKMAFILIPPGEFLMGSTEDEQARFLKGAKAANDSHAINRIPREGPQHRVRITRPFYLGKYAVTQAQWQAVMGNKPSAFGDNPSHPVGNVSWDDIQPMLAKLNGASKQQRMNFALPTEAQREYACRAGTTMAFSFGDGEADLAQYGWFNANSGSPRRTHPVGQLRPNAFGLYDMHGSVWEWCADWYAAHYYAKSPIDDPRGPSSGSYRAYRGGSRSDIARHCRSADRNYDAPGFRFHNLGFRLAITLPSDGQLIAATKTTDPDRAAAEWVLGVGGTITTDFGAFKAVEQLPQQEFRVTSIDLHNNPVNDAGLEHLKELTQLTVLNLGGTQVRDLEPLKDLTQLTTLTVWGTRVNDASLEHLKGLKYLTRLHLDCPQISDAGLEHLKGLTRLTHLFLLGARVSDAGLVHLKGLTQLTLLNLNGTKVTDAGLVHLKGLTKLTRLNLGQAESPGLLVSDAGLEHLKGLTNLTELFLARTTVSDAGLEHLRGLTKLTRLNLKGTKVTAQGIAELKKALPNCDITWDDPSASKPDPDRAAAEWVLGIGGTIQTEEAGTFFTLAKLPEGPLHVNRVELNYKEQVKDEDLQRLKSLTKLRHLSLVGTPISNAGIAHLKGMTGLTKLVLDTTKVDDEGLEYLNGLTKLTELNLGGTSVGDAGLEHVKGLTKLRLLILQGTQVSDAGLMQLKGLTNLSDLNLVNTQVGDSGLEHLKVLTNLAYLNLTGTQVSGTGLEHLKELTKMSRLNLPNTQVSDFGLEHLKGLTKLTFLDLSSTQVSDKGLQHLKELTKLTIFKLEKTNVTAQGIADLKKALPRCTIDGP